ncbi:MAG TPA: lipocalin-like domain-containing protein [Thermoleophilaceae bacterium]|nr:lipocalin-like domain-containing protein [Thermoleophilaceae bacterium]
METIVPRIATIALVGALTALLLGVLTSRSSGSTAREREVERRLVGTWRLVSATAQDAEGKSTSRPFGGDPVGKLTYTRTGHVWALTARRDAPRNVLPATWYTGTFRVEPSEHRVVHRVQYATIPSWEGTDLPRWYAFRADRLVLATAPRGQARLVLRWRKARL